MILKQGNGNTDMNMPLNTVGERQMQSAAATHRQETALPTPAELRQRLPVDERLARQVGRHRQAVRDILHGSDERTLIVVGPCSVHDEVAALEYGEKLKVLADALSDRFLIVMRAYLEKPRTTVGWKGLLYDPERTGSGDLNEGLLRSRRLLLNLAEMGLPVRAEVPTKIAAAAVRRTGTGDPMPTAATTAASSVLSVRMPVCNSSTGLRSSRYLIMGHTMDRCDETVTRPR